MIMLISAPSCFTLGLWFSRSFHSQSEISQFYFSPFKPTLSDWLLQKTWTAAGWGFCAHRVLWLIWPYAFFYTSYISKSTRNVWMERLEQSDTCDFGSWEWLVLIMFTLLKSLVMFSEHSSSCVYFIYLQTLHAWIRAIYSILIGRSS